MTSTNGTSDGRRSLLAGLLGQGIKPSLTPELHEREAGRQQIRYVYKTVELDDRRATPDHLRQLLDFAVELGFDGLNVTHPVKQAMVPLMDRVTPEAEAIGAINTVLIDDGVTTGHNTDVTGFDKAFRAGLPDAALDDVVLLGAGGAGTAVANAMVSLGVRRLHVVDPDTDQRQTLVRSAGQLSSDTDVRNLTAEELPGVLADASGLINATPVGMADHPGSPIPAELLQPSLWVADIVYRPLMTELLQAARATGCRTLDGAGMAVHQAADSFELITGRPAHRDAMFRDFDEMVEAEVAEIIHHAHPPAREPSRGRNE
ncbi:MAG: shikimate dehydrogenase [Aeromicrobium sp.]